MNNYNVTYCAEAHWSQVSCVVPETHEKLPLAKAFMSNKATADGFDLLKKTRSNGVDDEM